MLGGVTLELGKGDQALSHYRRALALNPNDPISNINIGNWNMLCRPSARRHRVLPEGAALSARAGSAEDQGSRRPAARLSRGWNQVERALRPASQRMKPHSREPSRRGPKGPLYARGNHRANLPPDLQYSYPLIRLHLWMHDAASLERMSLEQNRRITEVVKREQSRLGNFIRRRVPDPRDAEDILQEVFYELVEANRLLMPIEHVTGWLFRVARNRITDLFRKKRPESFSDGAVADEEGELLRLEDLLPSPDAGPDALYARSVLFEELESALDELPDEQREVFVGNEIEGRSFKEMAAETGVSVNTLLSRKRYAVLHLRERLQSIYDEFTKA